MALQTVAYALCFVCFYMEFEVPESLKPLNGCARLQDCHHIQNKYVHVKTFHLLSQGASFSIGGSISFSILYPGKI